MSDLIDPKSEDEESSCDDSIDNILELRPKIVAKRRLQALTSHSPEKSGSLDNGIVEDRKPTDAGKLWEETAIMRSLEEKMCSGNASSIAQLRDRGVETYALDLGKKKFNIKNRKNRKRRCANDVSDSILEQACEDMDDNEQKEATSEPAEGQLWDDLDVASKEIPLETSSKLTWRKRRANKFKRFKHSQKYEKQKQKKEFVPPQQFLPRHLVTADFEKDRLSSTVLDPETLELDQLANQLVEALGEKEPDLMHKAVELVGKQISVEIFKKCQEVEKQGGMLTKKGDRRRTPGGVFMQLFSEREDISEAQKKELFKLGNKTMKKKRKESQKTYKWKPKNKREDTTTTNLPVIENDLPTSSDVFKANISVPSDNSKGC